MTDFVNNGVGHQIRRRNVVNESSCCNVSAVHLNVQPGGRERKCPPEYVLRRAGWCHWHDRNGNIAPGLASEPTFLFLAYDVRIRYQGRFVGIQGASGEVNRNFGVLEYEAKILDHPLFHVLSEVGSVVHSDAKLLCLCC